VCDVHDVRDTVLACSVLRTGGAKEREKEGLEMCVGSNLTRQPLFPVEKHRPETELQRGENIDMESRSRGIELEELLGQELVELLLARGDPFQDLLNKLV